MGGKYFVVLESFPLHTSSGYTLGITSEVTLPAHVFQWLGDNFRYSRHVHIVNFLNPSSRSLDQVKCEASDA